MRINLWYNFLFKYVLHTFPTEVTGRIEHIFDTKNGAEMHVIRWALARNYFI